MLDFFYFLRVFKGLCCLAVCGPAEAGWRQKNKWVCVLVCVCVCSFSKAVCVLCMLRTQAVGKQMRGKWGWGRGGRLSDPWYALNAQDQIIKYSRPAMEGGSKTETITRGPPGMVGDRSEKSLKIKIGPIHMLFHIVTQSSTSVTSVTQDSYRSINVTHRLTP